MKNQPNTDEKITEVELVYRNPKNLSEQPSVTNSGKAYELLRNTWDENKIDLQEQSRVLLLNRKNQFLGVSTISTGGVSSAHIDLKLIFSLALKAHASSIIVAHNHPSGNLNFSDSDIRFTQDMVNIGEALDLPVLDHLIVTREGYSSMADKAIMPVAREKADFTMREDDDEYSGSSNAKSKPAFYVFNQNSNGEKPVGAIFLHGKGNGFNIVFDDKRRFVAFPPKSKPEASNNNTTPKRNSGTHPKK